MKDIYNKIQICKMYEIVVSSNETPIVATYALASCFAILLYNPKEKLAILCHTPSNYEIYLYQMLNLIPKNSGYWKYAIIMGNFVYDYEKELFEEKLEEKNNLENILNKYLNGNTYFVPLEVNKNDIHICENTDSSEFAFDTRTGKFISNEINFNDLRKSKSDKNGRIKK